MTSIRQIEYNTRIHDRIYNEYEKRHGEIFNPVEQERLRTSLTQAITCIKNLSQQKKALDYGCGSGNLTNHLIELGFDVTSADISDKFLSLIKQKYSCTKRSSTLKINGRDLLNIDNDSFDFAGVYSVLHHVPDYIRVVEELSRVVRSGGVVYIDHESNGAEWSEDPDYNTFLELVYPKIKKTWHRFLTPSYYIGKIRQMPLKIRRQINPRYMPEGDIHLWPDDHIEWNRIEEVLRTNDCEILLKEDYLLYRPWYSMNIYNNFKDKCTDMRLLVAVKKI